MNPNRVSLVNQLLLVADWDAALPKRSATKTLSPLRERNPRVGERTGTGVANLGYRRNRAQGEIITNRCTSNSKDLFIAASGNHAAN